MVKGSILLVNPWIYDFAAHNFWCEPLGLLWVAAVLRNVGYRVRLIDCLHECTERIGPYGTGKFTKTVVPKPYALLGVPRRYGRYGISSEVFERVLGALQRPDLILVTSGMTYWYPGVSEVVRRVKRRWPEVPVVLGGIYATLCHDHASLYSGADYVVRGEAEWCSSSVVEKCIADGVRGDGSCDGGSTTITTGPEPGSSLDELPIPAHDLRWDHALQLLGTPRIRRHARYIGLETSRGCPYRCSYCASSLLHPVFMRRSTEHVIEELQWYSTKYGVEHVAFYDDALLFQPESHILPLLDAIIGRDFKCALHAPNGLHARDIDATLARMMRRAGFKTVRVGFETSDAERQRDTGGKTINEDLVRAAAALREAGFRSDEIGAYVLVGLHGQTIDEITESMYFVHGCGVQVRIAQYSPLPGTEEWKVATEAGDLLSEEPLLHNNTVYSSLNGRISWRDMEGIKLCAHRLNAQLV